MALADEFKILDSSAGAAGREALRPPVKRADLTAASKALGVPLPAAIEELYEWHDGEVRTSTLFDEALHADFEVQWKAFSSSPYQVSFMTLEEVKRAGATEAWIFADGGATREKPEVGKAQKTVVVPFMWIRSQTAQREREANDAERELGEDDWLLGVDGMRGAVWLFEVGNEGLEGLFKDAPSLSKWLERSATKIAKIVGRAPKPGATPKQPGSAAAGVPALQTPAVLCLKFLLDRKQIELAEGATIEDLGSRITPLLALKPPKRAVRAVLDLLADDDAVDEVFADDDLLAKIVIEFVD